MINQEEQITGVGSLKMSINEARRIPVDELQLEVDLLDGPEVDEMEDRKYIFRLNDNGQDTMYRYISFRCSELGVTSINLDVTHFDDLVADSALELRCPVIVEGDCLTLGEMTVADFVEDRASEGPPIRVSVKCNMSLVLITERYGTLVSCIGYMARDVEVRGKPRVVSAESIFEYMTEGSRHTVSSMEDICEFA